MVCAQRANIGRVTRLRAALPCPKVGGRLRLGSSRAVCQQPDSGQPWGPGAQPRQPSRWLGALPASPGPPRPGERSGLLLRKEHAWRCQSPRPASWLSPSQLAAPLGPARPGPSRTHVSPGPPTAPAPRRRPAPNLRAEHTGARAGQGSRVSRGTLRPHALALHPFFPRLPRVGRQCRHPPTRHCRENSCSLSPVPFLVTAPLRPIAGSCGTYPMRPLPSLLTAAGFHASPPKIRPSPLSAQGSSKHTRRVTNLFKALQRLSLAARTRKALPQMPSATWPLPTSSLSSHANPHLLCSCHTGLLSGPLPWQACSRLCFFACSYTTIVFIKMCNI